MVIPVEILNVERPKNTVVAAYGKNKDKYSVIQRVGCKYVNGRNVPINGPTIGHIINGKYVPIETIDIAAASTDLKDWANVVFCDGSFKEIMDELLEVYSLNDTLKIYCIAILRVCYPGIKDYELKEQYDNCFLSELYPGVALSRNTVSDFQSELGRTYSRVVTFMQNRVKSIRMDHHILIDGTLKSDESDVNSLSNFSRKAKTKGTRDISVLYAFDLEDMEPICSSCYPGNMLDQTSFEHFLKQNRVEKGLLVGDKGFQVSSAGNYFNEHKDLHYLNPLKRNSKLIMKYNMYEYDGILKGYSGITYKKVKVSDKKYLYSFRNTRKAAKEEKDYLDREKKKGMFDQKAFESKQKEFGTIVLECTKDLPPEIVYKAYDSRWEIELVMRYYKSACEFDETRVHSDYSVLGSEFIDFLSSLLTFKNLKILDRTNLLEKYTYKKIMSILDRGKKIKLANKDWELIKMNPSQIDVLKELDILPKDPVKPKRKPGRPPKSSVI